MNFIKKIFDKSMDESVHLQFQKFSKGEFKNRAVIKAKNSSGKYSIYTIAEFANELVRIVAEKIKDQKVKVLGTIITTIDLKKEINFKEIKQFQGVKKYVIEYEMNGKEILELLNKFPKAFFALSFSTPDKETELKIKAKTPKSGKPGSKDEETPIPDFCKLKTNDKNISESFVFEKSNFKEALINHTFLIDNIIIPEELKKEKDFAKIREEAKRKGKIIREGEIDGQKIKTEMNFEA